MSRVDELISRTAPEGVRVKTLGDVGEFIRGNGLQKSDLTNEGTPAIHYGQIHTHYGVWANSTKSFTDPNLANKLRRARPGDLIIATTSEDDGAVAKATAWIGDSEVAVSGDAYIYRHSLDPRYAAYFFQSDQFQSQKTRHISGTKVRRISGTSLAKIRIPVPPLQVQREIVRTLDKFTQLEAELEAELEARRRQFAHYLHLQMAFSDDVPRAELGELVRIRNGKDYKALGPGETPVYGTGGIMLHVDKAAHPGPSVLIPRKGSLDKLYYVDRPFWTVDTIFYTEIGDRLVPKFLYYHLSTQRLEELNQAAGIPSLTQSVLNLLPVPVPPLEVQRESVRVLDEFSRLITELEAELEARRRQYGHYRDRLMTFGEMTV